jgi:ATP/maltotriose-dependent transcriptional regulator MalT
VDALLTAGSGALQAGDWPGARDAFRAALELRETGEALNGLSEALWWLGETRDSVAYRERAYAQFRRRSDPAQAASIALVLCVHYRANMANRAASAGWLARARRLVEENGLEDLRGWVLLLEAGETGDPGQGERLARETRELAAASGDLDLELCALAEVGACLVRRGRVNEGLALLDEAMAGSLGGEGGNFDTVVYTCCNMIGACVGCAEFERAVEWVRAADRFTERYGCPFLYVYCRMLYGSVLVATGDWARAEAELTTALRESQGSQTTTHALASAAFARTQIRRGGTFRQATSGGTTDFIDGQHIVAKSDIARLVAGFEGLAAPVLAAVHLARGNAELAAETAERALGEAGENQLERAVLAELLGEAEIARGAWKHAAERGRELSELGSARDCRVVLARGERLRGRAATAGLRPAAARKHLEAALAAFSRLGMPYETARTRQALAEALRRRSRAVAEAEARAALAAFEELGAGRDADAVAALLRELGVKAARSGPRGIGTLTKREREVLSLLGEGLSNPEIAERLFLSRKTVEHHVARVLRKLGLRNRAEAAAEAARRLGRESAAK